MVESVASGDCWVCAAEIGGGGDGGWEGAVGYTGIVGGK